MPHVHIDTSVARERNTAGIGYFALCKCRQSRLSDTRRCVGIATMTVIKHGLAAPIAALRPGLEQVGKVSSISVYSSALFVSHSTNLDWPETCQWTGATDR